MSVITLRVTEEKHERIKSLAVSRGVSVNKLIDEAMTLMIANKILKLASRLEPLKAILLQVLRYWIKCLKNEKLMIKPCQDKL